MLHTARAEVALKQLLEGLLAVIPAENLGEVVDHDTKIPLYKHGINLRG
jgi:hypothetical protein